jgi:CRP/FNR family transcriptional regulator, cyclic AMP receptor protein
MNLEHMIGSLDKQTFADGETIFTKGDPGHVMYIVADGEVDIAYDGNRSVRLGHGQSFGEMSLVDKRPRSATATAVGPTTLAPITQGLFLVLINETPYFALEVMQSMSDRLRAANHMDSSD